MNICIVTSANLPPEEGIGNYIFNLSKELFKKGHNVTVITRGDLRGIRREVFEGIEVYYIRFLPLYPLHVHIHSIFVKRFFKSIKSNFDIIHFHTPLPAIFNSELPKITTVHTPMKADISKVELVNPSSLAIKLQGNVSYYIERKLFGMSDKITCVATSVSLELRDYGLNPSEIIVVGNGVDENIFYPTKQKCEEKYVLYTGRLSYRKGLFDFIESGLIVCSLHPDVTFKLTGKGPLINKLKKIVNASVYKDRFQFLGHVKKDELVKLYQNATVFVLPSHYEGLPTTLLEGMACGLPVIATEISGNIDVIESNVNGILVPIKSPKRIAEEISKLLNDEGVRLRLGISARNTIEDRFSWSTISDKILCCYESVLNSDSSLNKKRAPAQLRK